MESTHILASASENSAELTPELHKHQAIIARTLLFIEGVGITAWAPLVPLLKERTGLSEGHLGALLLGLGVGAALSMMLIGRVYARLGCRSTILLSILLLFCPLPFLATATSLPIISAALLIFGLGIGAIDGSANIWAMTVDQQSERALMPGFHACFSIGGVISPTAVTLMLGIGLSATTAAIIICSICFAAVFYSARSLPTETTVNPTKSIAIPRGTVILLGVIFFIVMLAEAVMRDWSGVFLTTNRGVSADVAGFGYVAFATFMMLFRFIGDRLIRIFGMYWVVAGGGLCAAVGIAIALLIPSWEMALVGFGLVGVGCSNVVPMVFTAAGKQHAMPLSTAIPAVATVGYIGILGGPAVIGLIAQYSNLAIAMAALAVLMASILLCARVMKD